MRNLFSALTLALAVAVGTSPATAMDDRSTEPGQAEPKKDPIVTAIESAFALPKGMVLSQLPEKKQADLRNLRGQLEPRLTAALEQAVAADETEKLKAVAEVKKIREEIKGAIQRILSASNTEEPKHTTFDKHKDRERDEAERLRRQRQEEQRRWQENQRRHHYHQQKKREDEKKQHDAQRKRAEQAHKAQQTTNQKKDTPKAVSKKDSSSPPKNHSTKKDPPEKDTSRNDTPKKDPPKKDMSKKVAPKKDIPKKDTSKASKKDTVKTVKARSR